MKTLQIHIKSNIMGVIYLADIVLYDKLGIYETGVEWMGVS